ncbi:hypothetical protein [Lysobacter sp. A289]
MYQIKDTSISGINWQWIFMGGSIAGLLGLLVSALTLSVPIRVKVCYTPHSAMELKEFKSAVLSRIAASTSNFMGGGGATEWRGPVHTAVSFRQVIMRLCLRA